MHRGDGNDPACATTWTKVQDEERIQGALDICGSKSKCSVPSANSSDQRRGQWVLVKEVLERDRNGSRPRIFSGKRWFLQDHRFRGDEEIERPP